jgi:hypothetical protein
MLTNKRRAEIERAIGLWEWRRVVAHIPAMARELLAEIDRLNEAERIARDTIRLLRDAFDGPLKGLILLGDDYVRHGIPAMVREIVGLRGEVVELKESLVSRSELAATTIAGLEMENARLKAEIEALEHHSVYNPRWPPGVEGWHIRKEHVTSYIGYPTKEAAIAAYRKAAGLDPIFGSPVPPADGGPDA